MGTLWRDGRRGRDAARGHDGIEIEAGAFPHGAEDGGRGVGGQLEAPLGGGVVGQADGRAQVALVRGDVGVDGRGDESARLGGDDQGLRPRPLLWFPHRRFSLQLDVHVFSLETEREPRWLSLLGPGILQS